MARSTTRLSDVIERCEALIRDKRSECSPALDATVTVAIADIERLIHAAIWGDD